MPLFTRRSLVTGALASAALAGPAKARISSGLLTTGYRGANALYIARRLGLTTNLQLVLDPGDAASFTSGDKWLDLSGNGFDWYRGTSVSGDAGEPTFNGTAGNRSNAEYWSFDGGDYFRYDTTNETWMQNLHKDSAAFTLACVMFSSSSSPLIGTLGNSNSNTGTKISVATTAKTFIITIGNGTVTPALNDTWTHNVTIGLVWAFFAISVDEANSVVIRQVNSLQNTAALNYTSPSAGSASFTAEICANGNAGVPIGASGRLGPYWAWSRALSASELNALFNAIRGRFLI